MADAITDQYDPHLLAQRFQQLNVGNPPDRITLREGLDLMIDPRFHEGALGAAEGTVAIQQEGIHYIGAELRPHMPQTGDVKVVAGDDLLADQRFAPDMIKIDVEGFEQRVLTGLIRTLDRFRPDLHVEVHGPWLGMFGSSLQGIHAMLAELGYRMRLLDGREVDEARVEDLKYEMFHMTCSHRTTEWADRVSGCL
jgi:hypothetical protein